MSTEIKVNDTQRENNLGPLTAAEQPVRRFQDGWKAFMVEQPELGSRIEAGLLDSAGLQKEQLNEYCYTFGKLSPNDLRTLGTMCGAVGNRPFATQPVDFLIQEGVPYCLALFDVNTGEVASLALQLPVDKAEIFSGLISSANGSLQPTRSVAPDWAVFGSE
jgi:hypothetical protein